MESISTSPPNIDNTSLKYHFQSLSEDLLGNVDYPNNFDLEDATHVVSAITYGADAYFTFEKEVQDHEDKTEVAGSLEISVKSIPGFSISGRGSVDIDQNTKKKYENLRVSFKGDYDVLAPTTFEGAGTAFNRIKFS